MSNDSVLISKEEWLKRHDLNRQHHSHSFDILWDEYEHQVERMLQFTSAVIASPVEAEQIIKLLNTPLHAINTASPILIHKSNIATTQDQFNKAIELLEACSEDLFLGFGDDIELEHHVDEFLKEVKS